MLDLPSTVLVSTVVSINTTGIMNITGLDFTFEHFIFHPCLVLLVDASPAAVAGFWNNNRCNTSRRQEGL